MPTLQGTPVHNYSGTARASITQSVTVSAGTDLALVVLIACEETAANFNSVTFNGDALTQVGEVASANWSRSEIWAILNPDVGTFNVVASHPSATRIVGMSVLVLEDVHQTTGWRTAATAFTNGAATLTATVGSVTSSDFLIDVLTLDVTGHSPTAGANQTAIYATQALTGTESRSSSQSGASGGEMSWTWTGSTEGSLVAAAFISAGGGSTPKSGTDSATATDAVSSLSITATLTDSAMLSENTQIAIDTATAEGTVTESSALEQRYTATDSGTVTESASVSDDTGKSGTDSFALTESSAVAKSEAITATDSVALTETTDAIRQSVVDSASMAESASVDTGAPPPTGEGYHTQLPTVTTAFVEYSSQVEGTVRITACAGGTRTTDSTGTVRLTSSTGTVRTSEVTYSIVTTQVSGTLRTTTVEATV